MQTQQSQSPKQTRVSRRLKPEVAARLAARRRETELKRLYEQPVEELTPENIARMKAVFLRG
jgi:hypothetical protein